MIDEDIDRCLSAEDEIAISDGFVSSVMRAIEREADPAPMPFPWARALPGLLAFASAVIGCMIVMFQGAASAPSTSLSTAVAACVAAAMLVGFVLSLSALRMRQRISIPYSDLAIGDQGLRPGLS